MSATLRTMTSLVLGSVLVMGASASPTTTGADASTSRGGVPSFPHVFVIIGENTALSQLTPQTAPYLVDTLKPSSAWITNG